MTLQPPANLLITGLVSVDDKALPEALAARLPPAQVIARKHFILTTEPFDPSPTPLDVLSSRHILAAMDARGRCQFGKISIYQDLMVAELFQKALTVLWQPCPLYVVVLL